MSLVKALWGFALAVLVSGVAWAQDPGGHIVQGTIMVRNAPTDGSRPPFGAVPHVLVTLLGGGAHPAFRVAETDSLGRFEFEGAAPGTCILEASGERGMVLRQVVTTQESFLLDCHVLWLRPGGSPLGRFELGVSQEGQVVDVRCAPLHPLAVLVRRKHPGLAFMVLDPSHLRLSGSALALRGAAEDVARYDVPWSIQAALPGTALLAGDCVVCDLPSYNGLQLCTPWAGAREARGVSGFDLYMTPSLGQTER